MLCTTTCWWCWCWSVCGVPSPSVWLLIHFTSLIKLYFFFFFCFLYSFYFPPSFPYSCFVSMFELVSSSCYIFCKTGIFLITGRKRRKSVLPPILTFITPLHIISLLIIYHHHDEIKNNKEEWIRLMIMHTRVTLSFSRSFSHSFLFQKKILFFPLWSFPSLGFRHISSLSLHFLFYYNNKSIRLRFADYPSFLFLHFLIFNILFNDIFFWQYNARSLIISISPLSSSFFISPVIMMWLWSKKEKKHPH